MRILLDNCMPADLAPHIRGHEVSTAVGMGWAALDDRTLLDRMAGAFDVLVTVDTSIPYHQLMTGRPVAVIVLRARSNRVTHLARLIPELSQALRSIGPGNVRQIGA